VSFPSSGPLPPSRSASFKKTWKSQPAVSGTEIRSRASSLTPSRSSRRAPETSARLTNRTETQKPKELTRMLSRNFSGTFEPLRDDKLRRKASEDSSQQHEATRSTTLQSLRPQHNYGLDQDDRGRVRSGSLPALVERLTSEPDFIGVF